MDLFQPALEKRLREAGATLVGFADIRDQALPGGWDRAVALAIAYDPAVVACLGQNADRFERHLAETRERMNAVVAAGEAMLKERGFAVHVPAISKTLPGLVGEFSHKRAATKAGLGWIGKNALLVSRDYGCGFRLASLLTNAPLTAGTPVEASGCGACQACQRACPYGAIQGVTWRPGISRDALLNAALCHEMRESARSVLGYKHPCGLCISACPYGKKRML